MFVYSNWLSITLIKKPFISSIWPVYLPAGEQRNVTVYGGNLQQGNYVIFNSVLHLPLSVQSTTQATFVSPLSSLPGIYTVELFN